MNIEIYKGPSDKTNRIQSQHHCWVLGNYTKSTIAREAFPLSYLAQRETLELPA